MHKRVTFIGAGQMAEAMMAGMIKQRVLKPQQILASGPRLDRVNALSAQYGVQAFTNNAKAAAAADVVVLSVKPQLLGEVLATLPKPRPETIYLSIVAGASIGRIGSALDHDMVVRAMPNTPARIGEGVTVWTASKTISPVQKDIVSDILGSIGDEVFVDDENMLDMSTALSGSGPAYVCLFMEALIDSGVHMGFSRRISQKLVMQTVKGTVALLEDSKEHPSMLRNEVCSPGGTSAEALYFLEKEGFRTALSRACWAAYQRSIELGAKDAQFHIPENYTHNPTARRDYSKEGKNQM